MNKSLRDVALLEKNPLWGRKHIGLSHPFIDSFPKLSSPVISLLHDLTDYLLGSDSEKNTI